MKRSLIFPLGLGATLLLPLRARAGDSGVEQAKMYFNAGAKAYADGHYDTAVTLFAEAYKSAPRPAIVFSMAQAERKQYYVQKHPSVLVSAIKHYHEYLDQMPTGGRRDDAATALSELEPLAAHLSPETALAPSTVAPVETRIMVSSQTPKAMASIDGAAPSEVPLMVDVKPGRHRLHVMADGYFEEERDVSVLNGATLPTEITLREKPALVLIDADAGADVVVDGRLLGTTPLAHPLELASGPHYLVLLKNGRKALSQELDLVRGQSETVHARFETTGQRVVSYTFLAAGLAGTVAGGVFLGLTFSQQSRAQDVLDSKAKGNITASDVDAYNQAISQRDMWRTASIVALGAGVGAVATGLILFAFDKPSPSAAQPKEREQEPKPATPSPKEPMDMAASPITGPGLFGLGLTGHF